MPLLIPLKALRAVIEEPVVTGSLLYILTRGPAHIRERLLQPFRSNFLAKNGASRITTTIGFLKIYFVIGLLHRISNALNHLALNNWALRRQGQSFVFGPAKQELVVITGGSSGFGYEMVKAFSKVARVVAFDVNALPPELEKRECLPQDGDEDSSAVNLCNAQLRITESSDVFDGTAWLTA